MRKLLCVLFVQVLLFVQVSEGQTQKTKRLESLKTINVKDFNTEKNNFEGVKVKDSYYVLLSFKKLPSKGAKQLLEDNGVELLSFYSNNTYMASMPSSVDTGVLEDLNVKTVGLPSSKMRASKDIQSANYPTWAVKEEGKVDIALLLHSTISTLEKETLLQLHDIELLDDSQKKGTLIIGRIPSSNIEALYQSPLVSFVDVVQAPDQKMNYENRSLQKVNVLHSSLSGERNLRGNGVCIGVGDGGKLGSHIDFSDRIINKANGTYASFGAHGDHVSGIIGSGGNLDPRHNGMAPECTLLTQKTSLITANTEEYHNDYGMVLTNNSYGVGYDCNRNGEYNYTSANLDWQMVEYPKVLHVFAAGNSGAQTCGEYPLGFRSVLRYYQSAKNVLTVGNVTENRVISNNSSRGPVEDGRIKPEICGIGTNVRSTGNNYDYFLSSGTSMASPSVVGSLALLVESYRKNNNEETPDGALVKAIACNSADDLGNAGPDYKYGFGLINTKRAVETIEAGSFMIDEVEEGGQDTHTINIPAGVSQVKVMLYWHDKEAEAFPATALVNNLDLSLVDPSNESYLPWILDTTPANVNNAATRGVDNLNNIEQVTIDNPTEGSYTINVSGSAIPFGPQKYYIVYEFVMPSLQVTFPYGGESFFPGEAQRIYWDTDVTNASEFTIEYSVDGGNVWQTITSSRGANSRYMPWDVPEVVTENGFVRVTKNTGNVSSTNVFPFKILNAPAGLTTIPACEGYVSLEWEVLDYCDDYEIFMYNGVEMEMIGTTRETSFTLENALEIGQQYWFTVRAKSANGEYSEKAIAQSCIPQATGICPWENDARLSSIISRKVGRANTSKALTNSELVTLEIKNIGNNEITNIPVYYQVDNGDVISEIANTTITSGDSLAFNFEERSDLSAIGFHTINAWMALPDDTHLDNDSLLNQYEVYQIPNEPISLPILYDFEEIGYNEFTTNSISLGDLKMWDFEAPRPGGGVKGSDYALGMGKEMLFFLADSEEPGPQSVIDVGAVVTINMSNYTVNDAVNLSFTYHTDERDETNKVYVRGSDLDPWVFAYGIPESTRFDDHTGDIDISFILAKSGQQFSSSTQVKFGYEGGIPYAFDNVGLSLGEPLPVEIAYINVRKMDDDALVEWGTTVERNNSYFEIEAAIGDIAYQQNNFKVIGRIDGNGTTNNANDYKFLDIEPGKVGNRYYRLKQVDSDGTSIYSEAHAVQFGDIQGKMVLYPNPFVQQLRLHLISDEAGPITMMLFDAKGQHISTHDDELVEGEQDLAIDIDANLPSGYYVLKVTIGTNVLSYPIYKEGP